MALKFYTSVKKRLKVKLRKCLELIPTFVKVAGEKLVKVNSKAHLQVQHQVHHKVYLLVNYQNSY